MKSVTDLLIGLVLAESVDGPYCGRDPTDERDLENETEHTGERAPDGEEGKPGKQERDDKSHSRPFAADLVSL
jgi:hypothetical protein